MASTPKPLSHKKQQKVDTLMQQALRAHQRGDLASAARGYQKALKEAPGFPDALHLLGLVKYQGGDFATAIQLIEQAIGRSRQPLFYFNLGKVQKDNQDFTAAESAFRQALQLEPRYTQAMVNLGSVYEAWGRLDEAIAQYEHALQLQPTDALACNNLGVSYKQHHDFAAAQSWLQRAIELNPHYAEAYSNLGDLARIQGELEAAERYCRQAIDLTPDHADLWSNLGSVHIMQRRYRDAEDCFRRALTIAPQSAPALTGLGNTLREQGEVGEAITWLSKGLQGQAASHFDNAYFGCLLSTLNYAADISRQEVFTRHQQFGAAVAARVKAMGIKFDFTQRDRRLDRPLRIGYVSPDFRTHSCAYFLLPLLQQHDRQQVEITCYAEVARPDAVTTRFQAVAHQWHDTTIMSDEQLARQIHQDQIDILIDCAGHTEHNRLPVFGFKPAPVQMTWLGYPNSSGLDSMDYRLSDSIADPEDSDAYHSETLLRLPHGFLCFQPLEEMPAVSPLPARANGYITFGCLNNFAKVTPPVLALWLKLLKTVPHSRLMLKAAQLADSDLNARTLQYFTDQGITENRLSLVGQTPSRQEHFAHYHKIDIGLDPFPYNGTTTSCEAMWMGVPIVTLLGDRHAGRVGASLLTQVGLQHLIAPDEAHYVQLITELAEDFDQLDSLRTSLRNTVQNSPLCDAASFAHSMESVYRTAWQQWCENQIC
jgi:predicted O-linked N-acetylglucosamine transferase (SPINDLY family)